MNGMQQSPFLTQWNILMLQFLFDGAETFYHDFLSHSLSISIVFFPIISTWSDHLVLESIGLRIANQDKGKHVYLFRIEIGQCCDVYRLFFSTCLTHISHWSLWISLLQEDFLQSVELPISSFALRVIDCRNEIGHCSSFDSLFYLIPRSHQVRE